jgi:hypothetical protein
MIKVKNFAILRGFLFLKLLENLCLFLTKACCKILLQKYLKLSKIKKTKIFMFLIFLKISKFFDNLHFFQIFFFFFISKFVKCYFNILHIL